MTPADGSASEAEPWGHKITFVVYVPGSRRAANRAWRRGSVALGQEIPASTFIGCTLDAVQEGRCEACQQVTDAGKPTTCPECPSRKDSA